MSSLRRWLPFALSATLCLVAVGSALAFGTRQAASKLPVQHACSNGAVKAIVVVNADQNRGFMSGYSTDPSFFRTRWSCKAGARFQARRIDRGVYDVRVTGAIGATPLVTAVGGPLKIGTAALPDGGVQVTLTGVDAGGHDYLVDEPFVLVLV